MQGARLTPKKGGKRSDLKNEKKYNSNRIMIIIINNNNNNINTK